MYVEPDLPYLPYLTHPSLYRLGLGDLWPSPIIILQLLSLVRSVSILHLQYRGSKSATPRYGSQVCS